MARLKRPIEFGEYGADVLAVQQGLHRAGYDTNARNGNWGDKSVADMAAFQKDHGIQPTGMMGQISLDTLWPLMSGAQQEGYNSYKAQAPAIHRALYSGDHGDDVRAVQRMLYRALGGQATNAKNGKYGQKTVNDMILFQRSYGIQGTGNMGQSTFTQLWQFANDDDRTQYRGHKTPPPPNNEDRIRQALVSAARWSIANAGNSRYRQIRPYPRKLILPFHTDCSGSTSCFYCVAGGPDPNGRDFDGLGYTGTQKSNGRRVDRDKRKPGDLVFHGNTEGAQHVTMYLGGGRSYSFGSNPPGERAWDYRRVDEVRSYF
jgi:peptidoglycan hydrolase-like protein with peptidoglycan-binding domain